MKWVTWEGVGIDRMGCAWLIRTRIDPDAEFQFIREGSKDIPKGAEPFDIPGVRFSHHGGHCSFHTFLREHNLDDPILRRIAAIVDDADTVQEATMEPVSAGLDLICRGIRLKSPNDQVALERGGMIYEALYAQLRDDEKGDAT
jgi:hypothetical protein